MLIELKNSIKCSDADFVRVGAKLFEVGYRFGKNGQIGNLEFGYLNNFIKSRHQREKFATTRLNVPQINKVEVADRTFLYHFKIKEVAQMLFQSKTVRKLFKEDHERDQNDDPNILRDYHDAHNLRKEHDCYQARIELFADDFPVPQSRNRKACGVYFTFNNLPFHFVTKRSQIFPLMFIDRKIINQIGIKKAFAPIVEELSQLALPQEMGLDLPVRFTLCAFAGDNKGINEVLGISCAFNSMNACRSCTAGYQDF